MLSPIVLSKLNQNKSLSGVADYVPLGSTNKQCYELLTKKIEELKKECESLKDIKDAKDYDKWKDCSREMSLLTSARDALMDKDPNALFQYSTEKKPSELPLFYKIALPISGAACAYHGYRRNKSVRWALWWGFCGSLFFPVAPVIAFAQGFGKERKD